MKKKIYLIYIKWIDPTVHNSSNIYKDYYFIIQQTAGILVKEDEKYIRVALNIDETNEGDYIDIPKNLVIYEYRKILTVKS